MAFRHSTDFFMLEIWQEYSYILPLCVSSRFDLFRGVSSDLETPELSS